MTKARVLIVEDDPEMRRLLVDSLTGEEFAAHAFSSAQAMLAFLADNDADAIVSDIKLPGTGGLDLTATVTKTYPGLPVVLITAFGSMDTAIAGLRAGAYDFINKPFDPELLAIVLRRAVANRRLGEQLRRLEEDRLQAAVFSNLAGESQSMRELFKLITRVAVSDAPVLVTGESGTGKELVARALHERGPHADGPFVAVNCAAITETLLESELFGHEKGAFTDAKASKRGLFVQAHGGTIFLDEIGELPLSLQPKLLRALQEQKVRPVGAEREIAFNARVVTATNRDLDRAIEEGRFREDLFYRVNVLRVDLPPLRARAADVLLLAKRFLAVAGKRSGKKVAELSHAAAEKLLDYPWPGNVRELQNCIQHAVALAEFDHIRVEDLPQRVRDHQASYALVTSTNPSELVTLEEMERRYVMRVLDECQGNRTRAAEILRIGRKTLYRKLLEYGAPDES